MVMKNIILTIIVSFAFAFSGICSVTIAVLPYTVNYEGRIPKKMTAEKMAEAILFDSEKYQTAMIEQLSRIANKKKYTYLDINVIGQVQIEAMLYKSGIDTLVNSLTNAQLAEALGVTHVVRGTVTRMFIMSNEEALGAGFVGVLSGTTVSTATSGLNISNLLNDVTTNALVFSQQTSRTTKATRSDSRALRSVFRQSARRMLRKIKSKSEV